MILIPLPDRTAVGVAKALWKNVFLPFGAPVSLLSDNAAEYKSDLIKELTSLYGVKKIEICPRAPWSQGLCERKNQEITKILKGLVNPKQDNWDLQLTVVASLLNSSYHRIIECSPYFAVFGREYRLPTDLNEVGKMPIYNFDNIPKMLKRLHAKIYENLKYSIMKYQNTELAKKNEKTALKKVEPGDDIFVKTPTPPGKDRKLTPQFNGPYKCVRVHKPNQLDVIIGGKERRVHVNNVKVRKKIEPPSFLFIHQQPYKKEPQEISKNTSETINKKSEIPVGHSYNLRPRPTNKPNRLSVSFK